MFGSLTPLILGISGLKSGTGIVFHQASKHSAYSPSLTVLLCESIKIVASFLLLTRALHKERRKLDPALANGDGYSRLQAEDFEVQDDDELDKETPRAAFPSLLEEGGHNPTRVPSTLVEHILSQVFQLQGLRLVIPALIYVIQNNLYLYAASELEPAFFQALWQMRILMSATLSWVVLKKRILPIQWLCILGIFCGVMLVKSATTTTSRAPSSSDVDAALTPANASSAKTLTASLALCAAAALSSTAGVILEFIFRDRSVNLWASNVQLSCFSILPAACIVFFRDASHLGPVLHDLRASPWPMGVVFCQSFNGMMIAMLLKKAGVIINDFTSAVSIVLTFALNEMLFPSSSKIDGAMDVVLVVVGSGVILGCSIVYNRHMPEAPKAEQVVPIATQQSDEVKGLELELEPTYSASLSSSSSSSMSSPAASSVATPLRGAHVPYYFDFQKHDKQEEEPIPLLEMQDRHSLKVSPSS
ncbi:related to UDP-galactose transporter [Sporisorium scitamineum]|uniref:Related to UDP-galactose transporter n=1 Tax=Sporisorium scitamineum TaxID=49012 RepID=A0A0F7RT55_9BASI|nr:hypothetical protein [Sporisorium scitamineum]CDU23475.1 related to UDP-galactose transporter [Sporisorium scitamineum]